MGYTVIKGEKNGVSAEVKFFVPVGFNGEVQKFTVTNNSGDTKKLKIWSFLESETFLF